MIDYTFGYFKKVFPVILTKSKIFIFDRYYYDYYIDPKRAKINLPIWILKIGEVFVPKPDLILCLGGNPQKFMNANQKQALRKLHDKQMN